MFRKLLHRSDQLTFLSRNCPLVFVNRQNATEATKVSVHETGITAYNSTTKIKSPLLTKNAQLVTWYMCGPTVYDHSHIGHAWCYVNFDIQRRIMERYFDLNVIQVMNITDVDDKIIFKAKETNATIKEVAHIYMMDFLDDMAKLGVQPPTLLTKVTDYIPQIISFIEKVVKQGLAYSVSDGSVYFDVNAYSKKFIYGKLKPLSGPDIELDSSLKRSPHDFALWKGQKFEWEPSWLTPWGTKGRPGWHIECSAMASSIFGSWLDIHSGGIDLAFPHHENEEAQCCAYHDVQQWVGHWIHTGHLHLSGSVKMSKSLKNTINIKEFLQSYSADQLRMLCLLSHYRSEMEYSESSLNMAKEVLNSVYHFIADCQSYVANRSVSSSIDISSLLESLGEAKVKVRNHLADDFNTSQATNAVKYLMSSTQIQLNKKKPVTGGDSYCAGLEAVAAVCRFVSDFFESLGFDMKQNRNSNHSDAQLKVVMDDVIRFRSQVRRFALGLDVDGLSKTEKQKLITERRSLIEACDSLRDNLKNKGIQLKDNQTITTWSYSLP